MGTSYGFGGGGGGDSARPRTPTTPPPSGQQLVVKVEKNVLQVPWVPSGRAFGAHGLPRPVLLHPNTILIPIKTEYWDRAGGGGNINYDW